MKNLSLHTAETTLIVRAHIHRGKRSCPFGETQGAFTRTEGCQLLRSSIGQPSLVLPEWCSGSEVLSSCNEISIRDTRSQPEGWRKRGNWEATGQKVRKTGDAQRDATGLWPLSEAPCTQRVHWTFNQILFFIRSPSFIWLLFDRFWWFQVCFFKKLPVTFESRHLNLWAVKSL